MNSFREMFRMAFGIGCGVIASFLAFTAVLATLSLLLGAL